MPSSIRRLLLLPVLLLASTTARAQGVLHPGDRICLIGNAFAERMQHHGWFEARLQAAFPEMGLTVRNLGFSGDELTVRQRTAGFGTQDEWLTRCEADVILACFGFNESFNPEDRMSVLGSMRRSPRRTGQAFRSDLVQFHRAHTIDDLQRRAASGRSC